MGINSKIAKTIFLLCVLTLNFKHGYSQKKNNGFQLKLDINSDNDNNLIQLIIKTSNKESNDPCKCADKKKDLLKILFTKFDLGTTTPLSTTTHIPVTTQTLPEFSSTPVSTTTIEFPVTNVTESFPLTSTEYIAATTTEIMTETLSPIDIPTSTIEIPVINSTESVNLSYTESIASTTVEVMPLRLSGIFSSTVPEISSPDFPVTNIEEAMATTYTEDYFTDTNQEKYEFSVSTTISEVLCPYQFALHHNNKCYLKSLMERTWEEALLDCQAASADLVIIENQNEFDIALDLIKTHYLEDLWIGVSYDSMFDEWIWSNNTAFDMNPDWYCMGQSKFELGDGSCLGITRQAAENGTSSYCIRSFFCEESFYYACKADPIIS